MDKLSQTIEDYLSLIYVLERDHMPVVGAQMAEIFGVSAPTVTNTLKRMARDGLILMDAGGTRLTDRGRDAARTIVRRHMLTEWMMEKRLPWSKLHGEAHNLEHAISAEAEAALLEELGHPQTCPHGNPLPGYEKVVAGWVPLTQAQPGERIVIRRIHELAEHNSQMMSFFEKNGVVTGAEATVLEMLPFNETVMLDIGGNRLALGFATAKYVYGERKRSKP